MRKYRVLKRLSGANGFIEPGDEVEWTLEQAAIHLERGNIEELPVSRETPSRKPKMKDKTDGDTDSN